MYLLDTNVCIYFLKNKYEELTRKLLSCNPADLRISSITVFELEFGAAKSSWGAKTRQNLAMFLAPFNILPFDSDDAVTAGNIRAYLERQGSPIGPYDIQIAAQAVTKGLTVITHNISEFSRVPNLKYEDWVG